MSTYFTSDLHLGHSLAQKLRGFKTQEEHDWEVIESCARILTKRDCLWVLGDLAMDHNTLPLLKNIRARLWLILGNHDKFTLNEYKKYFEKIHGFTKYHEFWLSHCPIHPQEMYRCKGNIHGHLHKNTNSPPLPKPYFNVNWDYWRKPIQLESIREMFELNENFNELYT